MALFDTPTVAQAFNLIRTTKDLGFGEESVFPILDRLDVSIQNLHEVCGSGDSNRISHEVGEALFIGVELCGQANIPLKKVIGLGIQPWIDAPRRQQRKAHLDCTAGFIKSAFRSGGTILQAMALGGHFNAVVSLGQTFEICPQSALSFSAQRYQWQIHYIEMAANHKNRELAQLSKEEFTALMTEAKKAAQSLAPRVGI